MREKEEREERERLARAAAAAKEAEKKARREAKKAAEKAKRPPGADAGRPRGVISQDGDGAVAARKRSTARRARQVITDPRRLAVSRFFRLVDSRGTAVMHRLFDTLEVTPQATMLCAETPQLGTPELKQQNEEGQR